MAFIGLVFCLVLQAMHLLLVVSLSILAAKGQEAGEDESSQERTLGLFRHRNRYGYQPGGGGGGVFGGLLGGLFGGLSYNPYFGSG